MLVSADALPPEIVYGASGVLEVVQNVRTLLTTRKGTVPLDREFGLSFTFLDDPVLGAKAQIQQEVFQAIRKYEPRVVVKKIDFKQTGNDLLLGKLVPEVEIEVKV